MVWLGARTTVNPFYVQEIAESLQDSKIHVYIKNPIIPDMDLWYNAIKRMQSYNIKNIGAIHRGFYAEYKKVIPGIKEAIAKHDKKGTKDIWVCGHSLGGAMALLVAVELEPSGGCHTFGQPRVGNAEFISGINFSYYIPFSLMEAVVGIEPA